MKYNITLEEILNNQTINEIHDKNYKNAAIIYVNSLFNQITKTEELEIKTKISKIITRKDYEIFEDKLKKREGFIDGITYNYIVEEVNKTLEAKNKTINWNKVAIDFWELLPYIQKSATIIGGYNTILKNLNKAKNNATNNSIYLSCFLNQKERPDIFKYEDKNTIIFEYYFKEEYIKLFKKYNIPNNKIEEIKERNYAQTKSFLKIFPKITDNLLEENKEESKIVFEKKINNKYYIGINYKTNIKSKLKRIIKKTKLLFSPNKLKNELNNLKEQLKKEYIEQIKLLNNTQDILNKYKEQLIFFTTNFDLITKDSNHIIPKEIIKELEQYHTEVKNKYDLFINNINRTNFEIKDYMMIHFEKDKINEIYKDTKLKLNELKSEIKKQDEFILDKIVEIHDNLDEVNKKKYIKYIINLIDIKYGLKGHSERVSKIVEQMTIQYNEIHPSKLNVDDFKQAAWLHDIGKFWIPESILDYTRSNLTDMEYKFIKNHPKIGYKLLKKLKFKQIYCDAAGYHHEKMDGTGYPYGLKEEEIPLVAKFIMFADTFDSMMTRGYVKNKHKGKIIDINYIFKEIDKMKKIQFSEEYVELFKKSISKIYRQLYIKKNTENEKIEFDIGIERDIKKMW